MILRQYTSSQVPQSTSHIRQRPYLVYIQPGKPLFEMFNQPTPERTVQITTTSPMQFRAADAIQLTTCRSAPTTSHTLLFRYHFLCTHTQNILSCLFLIIKSNMYRAMISFSWVENFNKCIFMSRAIFHNHIPFSVLFGESRL